MGGDPLTKKRPESGARMPKRKAPLDSLLEFLEDDDARCGADSRDLEKSPGRPRVNRRADEKPCIEDHFTAAPMPKVCQSGGQNRADYPADSGKGHGLTRLRSFWDPIEGGGGVFAGP